MKKKSKNKLLFLSTLFFILAWGVFIYFVGSQNIIDFIGIENSYLTIFIIAAIGGLSSFTSASLYTLLATFITGGAKPLVIGISAGLGITIGDSLFFFFGKRGKKATSGKIKEKIKNFSKWLHNKNKAFLPLFILLYAGFSPLPNDVLAISLALTGYSYKKTIVPLLIGNIIHMLLFSYLINFGYTFWFS